MMSDSSEKSSQLMIIGSRGHRDKVHGQIGGAPVASKPAFMPLTTTFSSTSCPTGRQLPLFSVKRTTWRAAASVSAVRSGYQDEQRTRPADAAHDFHHHLIGIGGAVKGTGSVE